ncbi:disease resistance protein (TIR-NBS-LRR class) family [Actinidia rufa]|uniref:Disease resistance protein (TIR-NBS-LRR class) family n=1 Tax=Actinidia rufa TaxID=165716 RepID=A0A7J0ESE6_9ERIC|nr:disease resistance protein (TIR-NBS-LRR class) family [Actinidia rufa]
MASAAARPRYHVFLSFRGEDTRKAFTDHLYAALVAAGGFRTFRDDTDIERGESVRSALEAAIERSMSSIVVLSHRFASSRWCLDELAMALARRRESKHVVFPVFYGVDPSEIRRAVVGGGGSEKAAKWRAALEEVADLGGMVFQNQADGHESKFIQIIIQEVVSKLDRRVLSITPYPVGIESRIERINLWLQDGSDNVSIMVIYGMGGVGKTTIAKTIYNQKFEKFEGTSFLANIRETSKQPNGLACLQRKLLSDILKGRNENIQYVDEGVIQIEEGIGGKKVFIVLDDVDEVNQVNGMLGTRDWVEELDDNEALCLFSWHAFGQDRPIEAYLEHSKRVVSHCGGLPLALQVLGSSLSGESLDVWESALAKLNAFSDDKIQNALQISYDSLDYHDKNLFLDIACFFTRKEKDYTVKILDACNFYAKVGIQNLVNRCLVTINKENKIMMHQLLRDMGREIIRQESPKEPGKRTRLWHHSDVFNVLREKTGAETVEGLVFNLHELKENGVVKSVNSSQHNFEFLLHKSSLLRERNPSKRRRLGLFSWLATNSSTKESISELILDVELGTTAFSGMLNLRLLQLNNVRLTGGYKEFPKKLRWLCWRGFPLKHLPNDFPLESCVVLDLQNSNLQQLWKKSKLLVQLKILNLSHSHGLTNSPDFSKLPNLERKLPKEIVRLRSLEKLILSGCSRLKMLPHGLSNVSSLKELHADGMNQLLSSTGEIQPLHKLIWSWVSKRRRPKSVCSSLSLPSNLVSLNLSDCNLSGYGVLRDLETLSLLEELDLSGNPICSLPESIKSLTRLRTLVLERCNRLQTLPEFPKSLESLFLRECKSLELVPNLPNLFKGMYLDIGFSEKLVEGQGLFKLEAIANFCSELINYLGLAELATMPMLEVKLFNNLTYTNKICPVQQGLYECGIYSIFLPGSEIPGSFSKTRGSSISFTINPNLKIRGFDVCVVYAHSFNCTKSYWWHLCIEVSNKSKGLKWIYIPVFQGIPDEGKDMIWLSDWKIVGRLMEGGDIVNISVNTGPIFQVKEFGIHIVCEEQEKQCTEQVDIDAFHRKDAIDFSAYEMMTGEYFLCHDSDIMRDRLYSKAFNKGVSNWDFVETSAILSCRGANPMHPIYISIERSLGVVVFSFVSQTKRRGRRTKMAVKWVDDGSGNSGWRSQTRW